MNYRIKEVEKDDLYDYLYVSTYSWNETYKGLIDDEFLNKIKNEFDQNVERLKNKFDEDKIKEPNYKRFVLYVDDEAVGEFGVCASREETYSSSGELCALYLLNKSKSFGYGRIMFERAKEELKKMGYKDMIIYCLKDNPTNEFYKHMGGKYLFSKDKIIGGKNYIENVYYYEKI